MSAGCTIECEQDDTCTGRIDCGSASCTIKCSGVDACADGAIDNSGSCKVECCGDDACSGESATGCSFDYSPTCA
jgi:hypothetical protein